MKKFLSTVTACVILICTFTACNQTQKEFAGVEFEGTWGHLDRIVYNDLDSLEKDSDIVVVGTFTEDSEQKVEYRYNATFDKDIVSWVSSYNTIEVSEVLKGDAEVGDRLRLGQLYAVVDNRLISVSELTPMVKGDTWIFFLDHDEAADIYFCVGDSDGRYPMSHSSNKPLAVTKYSDLGVYDKSCFKSGIYNEIRKKYDV